MPSDANRQSTGLPWGANTRRATRAPPRIPRGSGRRRPRRSSGSGAGTGCSTTGTRRSIAGSRAAGSTPATTRSTGTSRAGAATSSRSSTTARSPETVRTLTFAELQDQVARFAGVLRGQGVGHGDRVIVYMPMVPEALIAMLGLRPHRRGAFGRVRRLRRARARRADRRCQAQARGVRLLRHRGRPGDPLQAAARRRDRGRSAQARALHRPRPAAGEGRADRRPRSRLGRGHGGRRGGGLRAGGGDRPALHPLHLGHHRAAQGHRARPWRPCGGAQLEHEEHLRRRAGRGVLGRLRRRLGGRPQLHLLRAAPARQHHDRLRGQAGRHPRSRRLLAGDRAARGGGAVHRTDRVPRDQEGGPRGAPHRQLRSRPASARCSSPASAAIPTRCTGRRRSSSGR